MIKRLAVAFVMAVMAGAIGSAHVLQQHPASGRMALLDRFLAPDARPLISYRAFRHLSATTRGGRMQASIDAWTTLDPVNGFRYEVTAAEGSGLIQKKVLVAALEAEQQAVASANK